MGRAVERNTNKERMICCNDKINRRLKHPIHLAELTGKGSVVAIAAVDEGHYDYYLFKVVYLFKMVWSHCNAVMRMTMDQFSPVDKVCYLDTFSWGKV